jgi:hypothetical protein
MIVVRYAVCSERSKKPVTRGVFDTRVEAEKTLERIRRAEAANPETAYWLAELGPECEAWRHLADEPAPVAQQ